MLDYYIAYIDATADGRTYLTAKQRYRVYLYTAATNRIYGYNDLAKKQLAYAKTLRETK